MSQPVALPNRPTHVDSTSNERTHTHVPTVIYHYVPTRQALFPPPSKTQISHKCPNGLMSQTNQANNVHNTTQNSPNGLKCPNQPSAYSPSKTTRSNQSQMFQRPSLKTTDRYSHRTKKPHPCPCRPELPITRPQRHLRTRENYTHVPNVPVSQTTKHIFLSKHHTRNNHVANVPTYSTRPTPCSTIEISENNMISYLSQMSQPNKYYAQPATHSKKFRANVPTNQPAFIPQINQKSHKCPKPGTPTFSSIKANRMACPMSRSKQAMSQPAKRKNKIAVNPDRFVRPTCSGIPIDINLMRQDYPFRIPKLVHSRGGAGPRPAEVSKKSQMSQCRNRVSDVYKLTRIKTRARPIVQPSSSFSSEPFTIARLCRSSFV